MIFLSTHTLDSSNGSHAAGINVRLFALVNNKLIELWSKQTDKSGRLTVEFELNEKYQDCDLQLSYDIQEYFAKAATGVQTKSICLNIRLPDPNGQYHLPIIISPHGASLLWSN